MITNIGKLDLSKFIGMEHFYVSIDKEEFLEDCEPEDTYNFCKGDTYYCPYEKILFDMINKKLNLEECYEILSYLLDEGSFRYDITFTVYEEIFNKIYKKLNKINKI